MNTDETQIFAAQRQRETGGTPVLRSDWRRVVGLALVLGVITGFVFLPARHGGFLNWDDLSYVAENDHVQGGLTGAGVVWAFTHSHSANWHPLTWLSHALDCQLYGLQPGGHHLTNVLFHAMNAALLLLLLRRLTGSLWRSALVAAIFALHPLRVESVAWLAERKDVLSMFFGLLTLLAYARYAQGKTKNEKLKMGGKAWYGAALAFFALGLMSKPMLVTWPCVMLLLDFWPLGRTTPGEGRGERGEGKIWGRLVLEKLPFFALAIAAGSVTMSVQQQGGAVASFEHLPLGFRLQTAAVAYTEYLAKFFWPVHLSPLYPHPAQWSLGRVAGAGAILAGLSVAVWWGRRRFPGGVTGWGWFLGTLVPVIGLVQVGSQAWADRYTYIPLIGVGLILVWLGAAAAQKLRLPKIVSGLLAGAMLGALAWRTTEQIAYWQNTETLFRRVLERSPDNAQALNGLGGYYLKVGRMAEGKQLLEQVIRLEPTFAEAHGALADALDGEGHFANAVQHYEAALAGQPDNASLLNNLAWLRAACPDAAIRNGAEAVRLATRACELTGFSKPLFIGTLAAAQAEAGDFPAAIATAERAAALATALRLEETTARNQELIELYRQGKAASGSKPEIRK